MQTFMFLRMDFGTVPSHNLGLSTHTTLSSHPSPNLGSLSILPENTRAEKMNKKSQGRLQP